LSPRQKTINKD